MQWLWRGRRSVLPLSTSSSSSVKGNFTKLTVAELKDSCQVAKLPVSGKKQELIQCLQAQYNSTVLGKRKYNDYNVSSSLDNWQPKLTRPRHVTATKKTSLLPDKEECINVEFPPGDLVSILGKKTPDKISVWKRQTSFFPGTTGGSAVPLWRR